MPPNVNTSTPASIVKERKASRVAPSAAVALQIRAPSMCTSMFISCAAVHKSLTSFAVYSVPSSVACVMETTRGCTWCSLPKRCSSECKSLGRNLASTEGISISFAPRKRSGAPASSTAMCDHEVHTTASAGCNMFARAITLAPVPPKANRVTTSLPNRSENAASASCVYRSLP